MAEETKRKNVVVELTEEQYHCLMQMRAHKNDAEAYAAWLENLKAATEMAQAEKDANKSVGRRILDWFAQIDPNNLVKTASGALGIMLVYKGKEVYEKYWDPVAAQQAPRMPR